MLNRFIAEVVGVNLRISLESPGGFPPDPDKRIAVSGFMHRTEMRTVGFGGLGVLAISSANHIVHIDNDLDTVFLQQGHQFFKMSERIIEPFFIHLYVFDVRASVDNLITEQIDIPRSQVVNILLLQVLPCRTHHTAAADIPLDAVRVFLHKVFRNLHTGDRSDGISLINQIAELQFSPSLLNSENDMNRLLVFRKTALQRNRLPFSLRSTHDRRNKKVVDALPEIARKNLSAPVRTARIRCDIFIADLPAETHPHSAHLLNGNVQNRSKRCIADPRRRRNHHRKNAVIEAHLILDAPGRTVSKNKILRRQRNFSRRQSCNERTERKKNNHQSFHKNLSVLRGRTRHAKKRPCLPFQVYLGFPDDADCINPAEAAEKISCFLRQKRLRSDPVIKERSPVRKKSSALHMPVHKCEIGNSAMQPSGREIAAIDADLIRSDIFNPGDCAAPEITGVISRHPVLFPEKHGTRIHACEFV